MRYAVIRRTGQRVDAARAHRGADFACPYCLGRVHLRAGGHRDAHFAHNTGEGKAECEEYYPGTRTDSPAKAGDGDDTEDDSNQLGLVVDLDRSTWALLLRVPELPAYELGQASLSDLREGLIEVFVGEKLTARLSALEVRPGIGIARAEVPPSLQDYRTEPMGNWPAGVMTSRWRATALPLSALGVLFRFRGGEWVRLASGARVRSGEQLVVVADERCQPPQATAPSSVGTLAANGLRWQLWRIQVPSEPSVVVLNWIESLGHQTVPKQWAVTIVSVPSASDVGNGPRFWIDEPLIARLSPPRTGATATLTLATDAGKRSVTVRAESEQPIYLSLTTSQPDSCRLEVADDYDAAVRFEFTERPSTALLIGELAAAPRLRLRVGEVWLTSWDQPGGGIARTGEVRVDGLPEIARIDVVIEGPRGRRILADLALRDAERAATEAMPYATATRLDGGNAGWICLTFDRGKQPLAAPLTAPLSRWLLAGAAARRTDGGIPSWSRRPDGRTEFLAADFAALAQVRSLASRRRRSAGPGQ